MLQFHSRVSQDSFVASFRSCLGTVGSVTLNPADILGPPVINANSFNTEWDKAVIRHAIRSSIAYMKSSAWAPFNIQPTFDPTIVDTDEKLDAFIGASGFGGELFIHLLIGKRAVLMGILVICFRSPRSWYSPNWSCE